MNIKYFLLKWKETTYFLGRNGCFKCNGVELMEMTDDILIHPITSKGLIGRAAIGIPKTEVKNLIEKLQSLTI